MFFSPLVWWCYLMQVFTGATYTYIPNVICSNMIHACITNWIMMVQHSLWWISDTIWPLVVQLYSHICRVSSCGHMLFRNLWVHACTHRPWVQVHLLRTSKSIVWHQLYIATGMGIIKVHKSIECHLSKHVFLTFSLAVLLYAMFTGGTYTMIAPNVICSNMIHASQIEPCWCHTVCDDIM